MVERVDDQITYEIEWDRRTLDGMHPVYRKRCERDGLTPETMWLGEEDIEPDEGTPVPIEQPTEIRTPPLSQGFRRWLCRNCFSQHDVGFSLQRVVRIEDQVDLPRTPLLDHHRMLQEVTTHRGEVHRLVTLW